MKKQLRVLLERKAEKVKSARAMLDASDTSGSVFTTEQQTQYDAIIADVDKLNASIERERLLEAQELDMSSIQLSDSPVITGGAPMLLQDPKRGFSHFGDFAKAVANATANHQIDNRLRIGAAAPSTYGGEDVGADGGFAVPPEFGKEIWTLSTMLSEGSFVPLTDNMPIAGNSMTFPSDETTPWGTDGIRAYWEGEADAANQTKPKIQPNTMRLNKLTALVPISEELLADAVGLPAFLSNKAGDSIRYKTNDAIINGNGVGRPLGITFASALVVQAKETSQTADTIKAENVVKMFSRLLSPGNGHWLINPDAFPQLPLMTIGDQPVYTMPNGLTVSPGGVLLGRPVILSDNCDTVGDQNDILFVNFKMYRTITKSGGVETATSMHLYFDAAAMAFRFIFRIAGQPIIKAAVTPPNSAVTRSGYVTLAVRA